MTFQTDPKVIAKLAKEREDKNWRFRSFLKGCDLKRELWHKSHDWEYNDSEDSSNL